MNHPAFQIAKTAIIIVIVIMPIYWLMFTEDGTRRTDVLLLWMFGGDTIYLNLKDVDAQYSPEEWKQIYPDLHWQCENNQSTFGNYFCYSEIASYNGIPARYLSVFFKQNRTSAIKLVYRSQYHESIGQDLLEQLGQPEYKQTQEGQFQKSEGIYRWVTQAGQILLKKDLDKHEKATVMWIAHGV